MEINIVYNNRAKETAQRILKAGKELDISWNTKSQDFNDTSPTLYYGISDFNLSKDEQARLFEEIIPNTILDVENYDIIKPYDLIIMKNPTRLLLWKDAKNLNGTKYLYVKNKDEWRINYSYGKVRGVFNKNIKDNVFGKADITQWSSEQNPDIREFLTCLTKEIAGVVEKYDLRSFGLDIIRDNTTGEFLFLELNQANSLGEEQCLYFLKGYLQFLSDNKRFKYIDELLPLLTEEEKEYLIQKLK
jgi:hypothetical protein